MYVQDKVGGGAAGHLSLCAAKRKEMEWFGIAWHGGEALWTARSLAPPQTLISCLTIDRIEFVTERNPGKIIVRPSVRPSVGCWVRLAGRRLQEGGPADALLPVSHADITAGRDGVRVGHIGR